MIKLAKQTYLLPIVPQGFYVGIDTGGTCILGYKTEGPNEKSIHAMSSISKELYDEFIRETERNLAKAKSTKKPPEDEDTPPVTDADGRRPSGPPSKDW